jgi:AcrR family transcriptional regulator
MGDLKPSAVRSSSFADTMTEMVVTAFQLVARQGGRLPTIAVLAHAMRMNRTNAYYYLSSQSALLMAMNAWTVGRLIECLTLPALAPECVGGFVGFVLEQPDAIRLLLQDLLAPAGVRDDLLLWPQLVDAMRQALAMAYPGQSADAEVHVAWLLAGAVTGPRLLQIHSLRDKTRHRIVERFSAEAHRLIPCAPALKGADRAAHVTLATQDGVSAG